MTTSNPTIADKSIIPAPRDERGHWIKGHSGNPKGRPLGDRNNTTKLAGERLKAVADKAAMVLEQELDSPVAMVRYAAAKEILNRTLTATLEGDSDSSESEWLTYLTDRELAVINRIMERGLARMEDDRQGRCPVIDVDPEQIDIPAPNLPVVTTPPEMREAAPEPPTVDRSPAPPRDANEDDEVEVFI